MALVFRDIKGAPLTHGEVDGNFRHLTGSHEISGSINVNGNITGSNLSLSGTDSVLAVASISASGGLTGSHLFISGNSQIDGNLTLGGNMIGGDSNTDSVTFNADVTSNIRPNTDDLYDIGTTTQRWKDIHAVTAQGEVSVQNHITASGTATLADEQYGIWIGPFSISGTVDIGADSNFVVTSFNRMNKIDLLNYSDY